MLSLIAMICGFMLGTHLHGAIKHKDKADGVLSVIYFTVIVICIANQ